jgi:hypothetical protein
MLSTVEFRSADDPQSLRGAGLDILWIDESAFIPNAGRVGRRLPGAHRQARRRHHDDDAERQELVLRSSGRTRRSRTSAVPRRVHEHRQPVLPAAMWEYALKHYHPVMFRQEFMAAFDAMAGVSLSGEWLKYFVDGNPDIQTDDIGLPRYRDDEREACARTLDMFIGVDPAISLSDTRTTSPSPHRPHEGPLAGVPARLLARPDPDPRAARQDPRVVPQVPTAVHRHRVRRVPGCARAARRAHGGAPARRPGDDQTKKKNDRLMQMGPVFRIGKVRIRKSHKEFIDQWVSFDHESRTTTTTFSTQSRSRSAPPASVPGGPASRLPSRTRGARASRRRRTSRSSATRTSETSTTPSWGRRRNHRKGSRRLPVAVTSAPGRLHAQAAAR